MIKVKEYIGGDRFKAVDIYLNEYITSSIDYIQNHNDRTNYLFEAVSHKISQLGYSNTKIISRIFTITIIASERDPDVYVVKLCDCYYLSGDVHLIILWFDSVKVNLIFGCEEEKINKLTIEFMETGDEFTYHNIPISEFVKIINGDLK